MERRQPRKRRLKGKLSITIDPEIRRKAEALARQQHRSISSLVESLIAREFEQRPPGPS